ncbi:MAG: ABC transporter ATP-binding protein [Candidatus Woesearchaeota archaeon]
MSFKEALKNNPIIFLFSREWKFSEGNRNKLVLAWFMFFIANFIDFFEPMIIGYVLNDIQNNGINSNNIASILILLGIFASLTVGFWIFHGPARVIENNNAFMARANYRKYMMDGTMNLNASWHTNHHSGDTIDKIEKGAQGLYDFASTNYELIETLVRLVGSYVALSYFNLPSAYIVIFIVIMAGFIILKFDQTLIKQYKTIFGAENKLSEKVYDIISNITTVIILRIEKLVSKEIWKKIMWPYSIYLKNIKLNELKWFLVSMCGTLMTITILGSYIYSAYTSNNLVMLGTIFVLYTYVNRITDIFFRFAYRYAHIVRWKTKVQNSEEVSNDFQDMKKNKNGLLSKKWNNIEIKDLEFSYEDQKNKKHLNKINLFIKRGQRIALVGESGSGKTTTLKVIRELYPITAGKILLDGNELKGFKEISSNISLIPQEPEIFTTTIKENITVGVNYSMNEVKKFSKLARFDDVAERLPNKYESSIVEKGVNLSGGEKQRLALARGLMASKDKEMILLDEPTSSVDSKNELEIYQNIFSHFKNKTILSSIHKLHLLILFDRIYYFKRGKIFAEGTFLELIDKSPEFKKLWEKYTKTHKEPLK